MAEFSEEQKKRADDCLKEINEILKKYNCTISATAIIKDNGSMRIEKSIVTLPSKIVKP